MPGQIERLHGALIEGRVQVQRLRLLPAEVEHVGRVVDAVDVDPGLQIVQQQAARAAPHVEHRLADLMDEFSIEGAIRPLGGVAAQQVPVLRHHASIFDVRISHAHFLVRVIARPVGPKQSPTLVGCEARRAEAIPIMP